MSETAIRLAAKLYEVRDGMRRILGDRYRERCLHWVQMLNLTMQRQGCDVLEAALILGKDLERQGAGTDLLMATAVEMTEGIFALPKVTSVIQYRQTHPAHPGKVAEGRAVVLRYLTAKNAPAPHMRPPERMLFVRGVDGAVTGQHFVVKQSEVVTS